MMQIRQARLDDARTLAELNCVVHQLHADEAGWFFKPAHVDEEMIQVYRNVLSNPDYFVYIGEVEGQPVGYIYCRLRCNLENPFAMAINYVDVDQMSLNEEYRGTGYADMLMQKAFDLARENGMTRVMLNVWSFNERAKRFYRKHGFTTNREFMIAELDS